MDQQEFTLLIHMTKKIIKVKHLISCMKWWKLTKALEKQLALKMQLQKRGFLFRLLHVQLK